MRPSGGSVMSDVRRSSVSWLPRSYQKSLYESTPPCERGAYPTLGAPFSGSNRARFSRFFSLASNAAASPGVRTSLPLRAAGRCSGVIVLKVYEPWRSGLPSAVRGGVYLPDCPAARGTTTETARALTMATRRGARIANPPEPVKPDGSGHLSRLWPLEQALQQCSLGLVCDRCLGEALRDLDFRAPRIGEVDDAQPGGVRAV